MPHLILVWNSFPTMYSSQTQVGVNVFDVVGVASTMPDSHRLNLYPCSSGSGCTVESLDRGVTV